MRSDLIDVPTTIELSKITIRNIKQNLFWAFGYNTLGIPIAMSFSSVSVLLNALRLMGFKPAK